MEVFRRVRDEIRRVFEAARAAGCWAEMRFAVAEADFFVGRVWVVVFSFCDPARERQRKAGVGAGQGFAPGAGTHAAGSSTPTNQRRIVMTHAVPIREILNQKEMRSGPSRPRPRSWTRLK